MTNCLPKSQKGRKATPKGKVLGFLVHNQDAYCKV